MTGSVMTLHVLLPAFLLYVFIASMLRFRRMNQKHREFNYPDRKALAKMTIGDAHKIQLYLFRYEFPFIARKALQFALFR